MYGDSKWISVKLLRETSSPRASGDETWSSKRAQRLGLCFISLWLKISSQIKHLDQANHLTKSMT
jgi:hypothetical protein